MERIFSFHKTAHGYGHIQRNQPCEDASSSWRDEDGRFFVAAVADGHGQARSFRSNIGSRFAAQIAVKCLRDTASAVLNTPEDTDAFYSAILESNSQRLLLMRQLTDSIIAQWYDCIHRDYTENPPAEEELGEFADYYSDPEKIPEIYGTTLIAALWMPACLILLHQGDGRCDVFYEDGTVDQPIPWDDRCIGNFCTSLCEPAARDAIRHCVIDFSKRRVAACYLGTDGVEDAYRDQSGTHVFYKDLSATLVDMEPQQFDCYLEEMLPEFSATGRFSPSGSADDVSVAGIVDRELLHPLTARFREDILRFQLEEKLFQAQTQLASKTRKHGILDKRRMEARERVRAYQGAEKKLERQRNALLQKREQMEEQLRQYEKKLDESEPEYRRFQEYLEECEDGEQESLFGEFQKGGLIFHLLKSAENKADKILRERRMRHMCLLNHQKELDAKIREKEEEIIQIRDVIQAQHETAEQEEALFLEYNNEYLEIQKQIADIQQQLTALDVDTSDPEHLQ